MTLLLSVLKGDTHNTVPLKGSLPAIVVCLVPRSDHVMDSNSYFEHSKSKCTQSGCVCLHHCVSVCSHCVKKSNDPTK